MGGIKGVESGFNFFFVRPLRGREAEGAMPNCQFAVKHDESHLLTAPKANFF